MDGIPQGGLGAGKGTGKKKVCFVITNRVHYTRCKQLIQQLKNHPQLELQLVVAASALLPKYGDVTSELERDGVPIHAKINMLLEGGSPITMAKTTGLGLLEMSTVLENLKPDVVLVRGDRYEVLAIAIAAAYMNIPLAHIEGGDVTGTIDESVRHAITKLAHLHFPTNELSKERIIKMGEDPKQVHNVGSLDIEYLTTLWTCFGSSPILMILSLESSLVGKCRCASLVMACLTLSSIVPVTSPPSMCAKGMFMYAAAMAMAKTSYLSPRTSTTSGLRFSRTVDISNKPRPVVFAMVIGEPPSRSMLIFA